MAPNPGTIQQAVAAVLKTNEAATNIINGIATLIELRNQRNNSVYDLSSIDFATNATVGNYDQAEIEAAQDAANSIVGGGDYQNIQKAVRN
jgi:hypothetical protein